MLELCVIEKYEIDGENRNRFAEQIDTFYDFLKTKNENAGLRHKLTEFKQRIDQLEKFNDR